MFKDDLLALAVALALLQQFMTAAPPEKAPIPSPAPQPSPSQPAKPPEQKPAVPPSVLFLDLTVGKGPAAAAGELVTVHLEAADSSGKELLSTRRRGLPYTLVLSPESKPLNDIIVGMREGGLRSASLPPDQLGGGKGLPPLIPPGIAVSLKVWLLKRAPAPPGR